MASLKDYRDRISSVKSTRKITSAMKMVAASKLRKAQEAAESNKAFAESMRAMTSRVAKSVGANVFSSHLLLSGNGKSRSHLLLVITASRGLCGGFNNNIVKMARAEIKRLQEEGKFFKIMCIGRKGYDILRREYPDNMMEVHTYDEMGRKGVTFSGVEGVAEELISKFAADDFDKCTVIYNRFRSVLIQEPVKFGILPLDIGYDAEQEAVEEEANASKQELTCACDFEPSDQEVLDKLLPINVAVQLFQAVLDSAAGEQAARMTAMDNATSAAGDMIDNLTLQYNRARQAAITNELIEIISGAEAT